MLNTSERNAIGKAQAMGGAAVVRRISRGEYQVPSATEADAFYTVTGTAMDASDHTCDCPAGMHGRACWHIAAVRLARVRAEALKQAKRLAERQPAAVAALPGERIAKATATLRINGIKYRGEGRNLIDAIGNAQAAA